MNITRLYRAFVIVLIALFMTLQIVGSSHEAQYGDSPHEHDGIACAIGATAQDHSVILPTQSAVLEPVNQLPHSYVSAYTSILYLTPPGRAPLPRSPPIQHYIDRFVEGH